MFKKKRAVKKEKVREPVARITIDRVINGWSVEVRRDVFDEEIYVFNYFENVLEFISLLELK